MWEEGESPSENDIRSVVPRALPCSDLVEARVIHFFNHYQDFISTKICFNINICNFFYIFNERFYVYFES